LWSPSKAASRPAGWLAAWLAGRPAAWLAGWLAAWLAGRLAGRPAGWLAWAPPQNYHAVVEPKKK